MIRPIINSVLLRILIFPALFLFTGCFEIVEQINLNEDGSGSFSLTLNLSRSKIKLHSIMVLDSINGHKVPKEGDINKKIDEGIAFLKQAEGISNVNVERNFSDFVFKISCDFNSLKELNLAVNHLIGSFDPAAANRDLGANYGFKDKTFQRFNPYDIAKGYEKVKTEDRLIFESAEYISIYRFFAPIGDFTNVASKVSPSGKAILTRVNILDLIEKEQHLQNTINLK